MLVMMKSSPRMGSLSGNLRHGLHPCCNLKPRLDRSLRNFDIIAMGRNTKMERAKSLGSRRQPGVVAAANTSRDSVIVPELQPYHQLMQHK